MDVAPKVVHPWPESTDLSWAEVHHALIPLMRADGSRSALGILREYACLAAVLSVGVWGYHAWCVGRVSHVAALLLVVPIIAAVAALQHRLSGLAHEASHYVLFRNPLANELASDVLLLFPLMAMTQKYRVGHLGHHQHVNDPARDPDWIRLAGYEPMAFPMAKGRFWVRYVARGLWPPAILRYLFGRAKAANVDTNQAAAKPLRTVYCSRVARCMRGAYWLSILTLVHAWRAWPIFWLFWVVPLLTFYPFTMLLREIAHHANAPDDGNLTNSRLFQINPILSWAVFPYGQDFHLTHHLFAMIPHHRMREAHEILSRYRPYRERVVICRGYFFRSIGTEGPSVLEVLSRTSDARAF